MNLKRMRRQDFDFWTVLQTRWADMDSLSHINHAAYLSYMESARVDVYIQMGYSGVRKEMDESTILGSMEVYYLQQVTHPCAFKIGHRISRVGNKSFDFVSAIFRRGEQEAVCAALFKLVAYSYKLNSTIPVPVAIRKYCRPF